MFEALSLMTLDTNWIGCMCWESGKHQYFIGEELRKERLVATVFSLYNTFSS